MPLGNKKKIINLGCGQRFISSWYNIDYQSNNKDVIQHNLNKGIPFPDNYFDAVYHSHVLEHFTKEDAEEFIKECHRVLIPGGIIRIAVPDLEQISKNYLEFLESADGGDKLAEANYDWTMIEMYDQCVRTESGGEMKFFFKNDKIINRDFIKKRIGYFFDVITNYKTSGWKKKIKEIIPEDKINLIRKLIKSISHIIPGEKNRQIGRFRLSGEIHQWMYDKFSLKRLLAKQGFDQIIRRTATDSYIENWYEYNLDTEPDGTIYKADSIYMEAKKI